MSSRDAQVALTVTLLATAALLALLCDFIRIRSLRRDLPLAQGRAPRTLARTLVPPH